MPRVIRVRRRHLALVAVGALLVTTLLLGLGRTPYHNGRALLLTRERWSILTYLGRAAAWIDAMERELLVLERVLGDTAGTSAASNLLALGEEGGLSLERLARVARQVDSADVPAALEGLHQHLTAALSAELSAAQQVLNSIGAPRPEVIADAMQAVAAAQEEVGRTEALVDAQRAAVSRDGGTDGR